MVELAELAYQTRIAPEDRTRSRLAIYAKRWPVVQRAAAHHGTLHRDAFYGSRAYWHTDSQRGLGFALDEPGDLNEPFYIASRGNILIAGDVNADIEVAGSAIVHILGNLNAKLKLKGVSEVVIAGSVTEQGSIVCDGQVEVFIAGNSAGKLGAMRSATYIIDGDASGIIQCSAPSTTITITGDLKAQLPAPKGEEAVLTLRIDGYTPTDAMLDLEFAGFTRVNATLGKSNVPPGMYPENAEATRPRARWVVLQQTVFPLENAE